MIPLPRPETTPPVTKIYLVCFIKSSLKNTIFLKKRKRIFADGKSYIRVGKHPCLQQYFDIIILPREFVKGFLKGETPTEFKVHFRCV